MRHCARTLELDFSVLQAWVIIWHGCRGFQLVLLLYMKQSSQECLISERGFISVDGFQRYTKHSDFRLLFNSFMTDDPTYRNHSIDLQSKWMDWFLYDRELHHERLKAVFIGIPEAYLGPCQPSMTEFFMKKVNKL